MDPFDIFSALLDVQQSWKDRPLERARCRRGVGNSWMAPRRFVEALAEFAEAEDCLVGIDALVTVLEELQ